MLILKPNVKHSTSVLLMELVVLPNTASFVPMEPYSTRTTSSVTGGSTLTVPQLRISTASMTRLLLKEMPLQEPQTKPSMEPHSLSMLPQFLHHQLIMLTTQLK